MVFSLFAFLLTSLAGEPFCDLKPDEEIVLFPAMGCRVSGSAAWELEVRGCVFEPERRGAALALLSKGLRLKGLKMSAAEEAVLRERARLFTVDNERGKQMVVRFAGRTFNLGESRRDGTFSGKIHLTAGEVQRLGAVSPTIEAVLPPGDQRVFSGAVMLMDDSGVTVVSDIDDTIKVTFVHDHRAMLRNTFLEPFRPVPGMAELYSTWATNRGAQFCYVSASPWQLFPPLSDLVLSNGFPAGVFSLKQVRPKDKSLLDLFEDPESFKRGAIEPLLKRFPGRQFVLIGDSGERDPEIYAALARRFPRQISRILIRDVTEEPADSLRYRETFRDLPPGLWRVFQAPLNLGGLTVP